MRAARVPYILCWALFCGGLALVIEMADSAKLGPSGSAGLSQWLANASNAVNEAISSATAQASQVAGKIFAKPAIQIQALQNRLKEKKTL